MAGALREILAKFGFDVDTAKLDAAKTKTDGLASGLKAMAATIAGTAIIGGIRSFVGELTEQAEQLRRTSEQLGLSTGELQNWQGAAKLAGVSNEGLATGFKFLQKNAVEAVTAGGDAAAEFKKLGVNVKDASGHVKGSSELMADVGLKIGAMTNPAERTAAALKLLGRGGLELIPLFKNGEEGLGEYLNRIKELGGGLSDNAIDTLGKYAKSTKEWDFALLSLKSRLAVELIPKLTDLVVWVTKGALAFSKLTEGSNLFTAAVTVLGTAAAIAAIKIYAPYLPIIALFAGLILLVDEVITLFQGGDTLIGAAIDKAFGAGAAAKMVDTLTAAFNSLGGVTGTLPLLIGAVGIALTAATSPILAVAAAVASVTAALDQLSKLREELGGSGWSDMAKKLKSDAGAFIGLDPDTTRENEIYSKGRSQFEASRGYTQDASGMISVPTQEDREARRNKEARADTFRGLGSMATWAVPKADKSPEATWAGASSIPAPPPSIARPPEPVIQKREITVKTQSDTKVTFSGPSPDKGDVAKGLADSGKALQAAVLASMEGQK